MDTPRVLLLSELRADHPVLTGIAAGSCVAPTLHAHMLEYPLHVPSDCVAATSTARRDWAPALLARRWACAPRRGAASGSETADGPL